MHINLNGELVGLRGEANSVVDAALEQLVAMGGLRASVEEVPDALLVSLPLVPDAGVDAHPLLAEARSLADRMAKRGSGRIVFILSAIGSLPTRRHPEYSVQMAAAVAGMRSLAMTFGPNLCVNAVGVGAIGDPIEAGDLAMLSHASVGRAGTVAEVVDTILFLCDPMNSYTTGQMLNVDGGWTAGYGRDF